MITQEELKSLLNYDPETGLFTWLKANTRRVKAGDIAGTKSEYGYIRIRIKDKTYRAHRLAWLYVYGVNPILIDHINMVRDDNRLVNLREADKSKNKLNMGKRSDNKSGFKGVSYSKQSNKWRAACSVNKKQVYLGLYETPEMAFDVYKSFAKKHHGEFYRAE